jgi:adenylate kinase
MRLVLIGPPGAGKGTQAEMLAIHFGIPHIATGDMIREEIARRTPLGRRVDELIAGGDFIADSEMIAMVQKRLAEPDAESGFILDGFPRDLAQAKIFSTTPDGKSLNAVIVLDLPEQKIVERLSERLICPICGRSYHEQAGARESGLVCDQDGAALVRRPDDAPEAIRHRIAVYNQVTAPLIRYYSEQGLVREVDASAEPDQVFAEIVRALDGNKAQNLSH